MCQWAHTHRIHWCYLVSHHPERTVLIEERNRILKTQLQCQLGGNTLRDWDKVLQKAAEALSQCPIYGAICLLARKHGSVQVEMGVALLTIAPSDLLANFLLPVSITLCSAGREAWISEKRFYPVWVA